MGPRCNVKTYFSLKQKVFPAVAKAYTVPFFVLPGAMFFSLHTYTSYIYLGHVIVRRAALSYFVVRHRFLDETYGSSIGETP